MHPNEPSDPQELLEHLRRRPAMITGEATLTSIYHFLSGYSWAIEKYDVAKSDDPMVIPHEFHDWVAYRLHFFESTSGWCRMICTKSNSDGAAIERFFELLEEFQSRSPRLVAKLTGYRKTYKRFALLRENDRAVEGQAETLSYPDSISLVTYTDDPGFFAYSDTEDKFPGEGFFPTTESFEHLTGASRAMLSIVDPQWRIEG